MDELVYQIIIIEGDVRTFIQMDFIQSKIRALAGELIKSRKYNYSQEGLHNYLEANPGIKCHHTMVKNKRG